MADEKSKQGYEDMLASVRKIVASELPPPSEPDSGKLLLTPALRVAEPETPTDAPEPSPRDFPTLAERIAELEAAVGNAPAEWEPDGSEDQGQHTPDAVVLPLNLSARRQAGLSRGNETNDADIVFAVPGDPPQEADDPISSSDTSADTDANADVDTDADAPPAATPLQLGEAAHASDAAVEDRSEPVEPSLPPVATFRHREAPEAPERSYDADDEPFVLEEAALRELVSEIVREELQGGLGERITRNVRKLVRAEIQRAFAARDLD